MGKFNDGVDVVLGQYKCPACGELLSTDITEIEEHHLTCRKSIKVDYSTIYVITPSCSATKEQILECNSYIVSLEDDGFKVFSSNREYDSSDSTGYKQVTEKIEDMASADEVHVMWDSTSLTSHFELGIAMALAKPIKLIKAFYPDTINAQTFYKTMQMWDLVDVE
jgi:hypothetical protein